MSNSTNPQLVDFVVESPTREVRLAVEAKNTATPSRDWATRYLRNLFAHGAVPHTDFFCLAMRDHFFIWRKPGPDVERAPDFELDTYEVLSPYLGEHSQLATLDERSFELLVHAWLNDLVAGQAVVTSDEPPQADILRESVRNGTVRVERAA